VVDQLRFALERAVRAPSSHNTQPWRFGLRSGAIDVYADRERQLPVVDPVGRELVMSCGAALLNLELALAHLGRAADVELLPEPAEPDLLARVRLGGERPPTADQERLFEAIDKRRTNRRPFSATPLPSDTVLLALEGAARAEGARFVRIADEVRVRVADLVAEGDRRLYADRRFRSELAAWCRPNRSGRPDGIPGYALGFGDAASLLAPLALRAFNLGRSQAAKSRGLAAAAPLLALIETDGDTTQEWLRAGRALQHVLLEATAAGISASFLNQPVEVPELRTELQRVVNGSGAPQLLLRLGYGPDVRPTPRRPLEDVVHPLMATERARSD
jgi:nitroreductase